MHFEMKQDMFGQNHLNALRWSESAVYIYKWQCYGVFGRARRSHTLDSCISFRRLKFGWNWSRIPKYNRCPLRIVFWQKTWQQLNLLQFGQFYVVCAWLAYRVYCAVHVHVTGRGLGVHRGFQKACRFLRKHLLLSTKATKAAARITGFWAFNCQIFTIISFPL